MRSSLCRVPALTFLPSASARRTASIRESQEINFQRLAEVNEALSIPLVLHGGTGIPAEDVRKAIKNGINKVNVGTIIKYTYLSSVFETLKRVGPTIHTIDLMLPAVEAIKEEVKRWIAVCMSDGKA